MEASTASVREAETTYNTALAKVKSVAARRRAAITTGRGNVATLGVELNDAKWELKQCLSKLRSAKKKLAAEPQVRVGCASIIYCRFLVYFVCVSFLSSTVCLFDAV